MRIVCDTREQKAFEFASYPDVTVVKGTLQSGDYSLCGLEAHCAIERKSLSDLVACLGRDRDRFFRELNRAKGLECFAVVVESTWAALAGGQYKSKLNPKSAVATCCAIMARLGIPIVFAGSRRAAEEVTHNLLRQYARGALRKADVLRSALEENESEVSTR